MNLILSLPRSFWSSNGRLQNELAMSLDKQASSPGVSSDDVEDDEGKAARAALLARARGMYAAAGETQVRLSHLTALDPEDASAYFWRGAELFCLGRSAQARRPTCNRSFAERVSRPSDGASGVAAGGPVASADWSPGDGG